MDPKVTIQEIVENGISRDLREAYNGWVYGGGFKARVKLHPATDLWMRGARYGLVERVGARYLHVKLDATGKVHRIHPSDLI